MSHCDNPQKQQAVPFSSTLADDGRPLLRMCGEDPESMLVMNGFPLRDSVPPQLRAVFQLCPEDCGTVGMCTMHGGRLCHHIANMHK